MAAHTAYERGDNLNNLQVCCQPNVPHVLTVDTVFVVEGHEKRIKKDLLPVSSEPKE